MSRIRAALDALRDNQETLTRWGVIAIAANAALVSLCVEGSWLFSSPPPPPPDHWNVEVNESLTTQEVSARAKDFIKHYLETTRADAGKLQDFLTFPVDKLSFPEKPPGATVVNWDAEFVTPLDRLDPGGQRWTAVVWADVRDPSSSASERLWFQFPLLLVDATARVQTPPSWIAEPDAGYYLDTDYPASVESDETAYAAVRNFLTAYMTKGDITPYVTADAGIQTPKHRLKQLVKLTVTAQTSLPDIPAPGAEAHVLALAWALTTGGLDPAATAGLALSLSYQIDLRESGGHWAVGALEEFPQTKGAPR